MSANSPHADLGTRLTNSESTFSPIYERKTANRKKVCFTAGAPRMTYDMGGEVAELTDEKCNFYLWVRLETFQRRLEWGTYYVHSM